ncbi:MAG: membrane protein insertion efficiency factor YidD [Legionellaceae bacterium]|nr:membrane protein insertion efficiency factor YidD [Legionellaceae bacterium]
MRSVQFLIRLYQYVISPYIQSSCRFHPSCSQYALDALAYHGVGKGLWLSCRRLLRCHPWADGGYDPVLSFNEKEKP